MGNGTSRVRVVGFGPMCGIDGLGQDKSHGIGQSIRAQRSRAQSAFNWRVINPKRDYTFKLMS